MDWLVPLDEHVFLALNRAWSPEFDAFFSVATYLGHGLVLALLVLGPMALWDRRRLRTDAVAMVLSVALGALAVEGLKSAVERERPAAHFAGAGVEVRMPAEELYDRSFPSGHTQAAAGTATYVALLYPGLAPWAVLGAVLVGWSRVYLGVHFPLDVLGGALVGVLFSVAGFTLRRRLGAGRTSSRSTAG
ncbi:MAG: phosphatase PAP2 family protein [Deltaproteobacteria bacterium]|nr:phosphatase PAP2 family protein [Deltaproteobacteria bacterium]